MNNAMVTFKHITINAVCPHDDKSPIVGHCSIAYIPNKKIISLSRIPQLVYDLTSTPRLQEELTQEIANTLEKSLKPKGIAVVIQAKHDCMLKRGTKKGDNEIVTTILTGKFNKANIAEEFFLSLR